MKKKLKKFFAPTLKLKKFFTRTFWVLINLAAIAVIVLFFGEEFSPALSRNIWINVSILIIGIILIKEVPVIIRRIFEKIERKDKNKFFKRMFLLLTNLNLNILATITILAAINGTCSLTTDIFFAKMAVGIIFIINIYKIKKLLNKMRKNKPVKYIC